MVQDNSVNIDIFTDCDYFIFELNYNKKSYTISAKDKINLPSTVVLPKEYEGLPITRIKYNGFSGCKCINSVVIPNTIITIDGNVMKKQGAFSGCTSLSIVVFEEESRTQKIGSFAFSECSELESFEITKNVRSIEDGAFRFCTKLQQVYINIPMPPRLGMKVFYKASDFLNIYVPAENVVCYKYSSFWNRYRDRIILLPEHIPTSLGFFKFQLNDDGESYSVYPKDVSILPSHLVIPSYYNRKPVTIIGKEAFIRCEILENVILPDKLLVVDSSAFSQAPNIRELIIPNSVERLEEEAFSVSMTSFSSGDIPTFSRSLLEKVIFGENSKLTYIGDGAFSGSINLKDFKIPKRVKHIGAKAFGGIGASFVNIPENVETIGIEPFQRSTAINRITVNKNNRFFKDIEGVLYNKDGTVLLQYPAAKEDNNYSMPTTVGKILGGSAFYGCMNLRVLYMNSIQPPTVTSSFQTGFQGFKVYVPDEAVDNYKQAEGWSRIKSIIYPQSYIKNGFATDQNALIQYVGNEASITILENIEEIQDFALAGCANLKHIDVSPNNYTFKSVDGVLFNENLTKVICFPPAKPEKKHEIPKGVKELGVASFLRCKNLLKIEIHSSVEQIDDYAFYQCFSLKEVKNIDGRDQIKAIGRYAFQNCSSIEKVQLKSIESIANAAFSICNNIQIFSIGENVKTIGGSVWYTGLMPSKLSKLKVKALNPPVISQYMFLGQSVVPVYVPFDSIELYKNAPVWQLYKDSIYPLFLSIIE